VGGGGGRTGNLTANRKEKARQMRDQNFELEGGAFGVMNENGSLGTTAAEKTQDSGERENGFTGN